MKFSELAIRYVQMKRALGMKYIGAERIFRTFMREVGDPELRSIRPEAIRSFLDDRSAATRQIYRNAFDGLWHFAVARGHAASSPVPPPERRFASGFVPYIYTREEIGRLLTATSCLDAPLCPLRPLTYRTMILLLYGTGLRIGEAMRLTLGDVNLRDRVLAIHETKFYKTRLVPVGPHLADALVDYREKRLCLPQPHGKHSIFFCLEKARKRGQMIGVTMIRAAFRQIRLHARIYRRDESPFGPRIHDLRHTFVVHRIEDWYREGADVDNLLPALATYIGHVNIEALTRYITMTPLMLSEAGRRFERYVAPVEPI